MSLSSENQMIGRAIGNFRLEDGSDLSFIIFINPPGYVITDRYGQFPEPVANLLAVARFRIHARRAGVAEVVSQGNHIRLAPVELPESRALRLGRLYPGSLFKPATRTILVPRPMTARVGGQPVRDTALLDWLGELLDAILLEPVSAR